MSECLFCGIVKGTVPAKPVYQDDDFLAFPDINPHAPVHLLVIPKRHIDSLPATRTEDAELLGRLLLAARKIASENDRDNHGYRVVINTGKQADIDHLHVHVLTGRQKLGAMAEGGE